MNARYRLFFLINADGKAFLKDEGMPGPIEANGKRRRLDARSIVVQMRDAHL